MTLLTAAHVLISVIGIVSGFVVVSGMVADRPRGGCAGLFLASTVLTSATGFLFPFHRLLPSHAVGILSLAVLAVAIYARYARRLAGAWRKTYVVTAVAALYLNVFVLVAQAFQKVPALRALAPTQSEPPFTEAQSVVLVIFIVLGAVAAVRFKSPLGEPGGG
jgi:hypothetical protein